MSSLMEQPLDLVNNLQQQISCVLVLFVAWVVFYVVVDQTLNTKGLSRKKELDTKNRIVSIVHGLVTFILGMTQFFPLASFEYLLSWDSLPNTPIQSFTNMFALSYSVYDVIACVYFGISDTGFLLHHLFCWAAFGTVAFSGWGGIASMGGFVVAEISNFPMHIRTILKNYSLRYTLAYELCEILYIGTFLSFICSFVRLCQGDFLPVFCTVSLLTFG